jgi:DNA-binding transcriptional ArsR family regulator
MDGQMPLEDRTRRILACLGDASRFRLVSTLAESERCVGELATAVGLSQSCTTRHLQALGRLGLVEGRREGRRVLFRLNPRAPGLEGILVWALSEAGVAAILAADQSGPGGDDGERGAKAGSRPTPGMRRRSPAHTESGSSGEQRRIGSEGSRPVEDAENVGVEDISSGHDAGAGHIRRGDDLEDYLL